jgi:hypothetical protein
MRFGIWIDMPRGARNVLRIRSQLESEEERYTFETEVLLTKQERRNIPSPDLSWQRDTCFSWIALFSFGNLFYTRSNCLSIEEVTE